MHLLVVETDNRLGIEHTLREILPDGCRMTHATCTEDARELINLLPVDVVVLDFTFCEPRFLDECRHHVPALPTVFVVDDPFLPQFRQLKVSGHPCVSAGGLREEVLPVVEELLEQAPVPLNCLAERRFEFELDNDKSRVSVVVQMLLDVCESVGVCNDADRFRIGVALEEALVNAIVHGNLGVSSELRERGDDSYEQLILERQSDPHYACRRVKLAGCIGPTEARFVIRDQGAGFDVSKLPDPTNPEFLDRPCGRGLLLMRSFMSEVNYNSQGNEVTLIRRNLSRSASHSTPELTRLTEPAEVV